MKIKYISLIIFIILLNTFHAEAQRIVKGKVIQIDTKLPIAGVNIIAEGTSSRTSTDIYGIYEILVPDSSTALIFSFVGMDTEKIIPGNEEIIHVSMRKIDISYEELYNIKVVSASKVSEKISKAPAILTVVSKKEIEKLRSTTLLQLLDQLTAIYTTGSYCFKDNIAVVRGNVQSHFNNNVLVLIDGRPMRESIYGGIDAPIFLAFPINCIERIEIIRGPGSVLYGTNAFTGVINIITNNISTNTTTASVKYGTFNTRQFELNSAINKNGFKVMFGLNYLKDDGWNFDTPNESDPIGTPPTTIKYSQEITGIFGKIEYKDFKIQGVFAHTPFTAFGPVPTLPGDIIDETRALVDLGYNHSFSKKYDISVNLTYNRFYMELPLPLSGPNLSSGIYDYFLKANDYLFEFTNFIHPNERTNVTLGGVVINRTGEAHAIMNTNYHQVVPQYNEMLYSIYGQIDYQPTNHIKLITGAQINKAPGIDLDIVPRLGIILSLLKNDLLGFKILYAKAFRSQTAFEVKSNMPGVVIGNNDLVPEKIGTLDFQILYHPKGFDFTLGYFNSDHTNQITRAFDAEINSLRYINGGWIKSHGFEFEAKCVSIKNLSLSTSAAYQTNENKAGQTDVSHIPNYMIKFNASYEFNNGFTFTVSNSYYSKPSDVSNVNPNRKFMNPEPQSFNYLCAGIQLDIVKNFNLRKFPQTLFHIHGENLLNETINNPEFQRRNMNSIPGRPGIFIVGGFTVSF